MRQNKTDGYFLEHCAVTRSSFITATLVTTTVLPVLFVCFLHTQVFNLSLSLSILKIPLSHVPVLLCNTITPFEYYSQDSQQRLLPHLMNLCRKIKTFFKTNKKNLLKINKKKTWLFHPCWNSWTGAPKFSQEK